LNSGLQALDADRFADANDASVDEETMEPSIEAQMDTPLKAAQDGPDTFSAEFEEFFPSEGSFGTNDATKHSVTSHPIMPSTRGSDLNEDISGMTLSYKQKKSLKALVDQEQMTMHSDIKSLRGDLSSADVDVSSAYTKSVDGRSYRSYSSGEQTVKTENSCRHFDNIYGQGSKLHTTTPHSNLEPPGTYAAANHELCRSSSDPFIHAEANAARPQRLKADNVGLQRSSTAPTGRGEPGFLTRRRMSIEPNLRVESLDENDDCDEPLLPPLSMGSETSDSDENDNEAGIETSFEGEDGRTFDKYVVEPDFEDSEMNREGSCLSDENQLEKESVSSEAKLCTDDSQRISRSKAPSEAGSTVTELVGNGLAQGKNHRE
jgi:hypothetical protein